MQNSGADAEGALSAVYFRLADTENAAYWGMYSQRRWRRSLAAFLGKQVYFQATVEDMRHSGDYHQVCLGHLRIDGISLDCPPLHEEHVWSRVTAGFYSQCQGLHDAGQSTELKGYAVVSPYSRAIGSCDLGFHRVWNLRYRTSDRLWTALSPDPLQNTNATSPTTEMIDEHRRSSDRIVRVLRQFVSRKTGQFFRSCVSEQLGSQYASAVLFELDRRLSSQQLPEPKDIEIFLSHVR